MFFRKKYLLAKIESAYGTDPVPDNSNGIITTNMQISPYEGNKVKLNRDRDYLGNDAEINTGPTVVIEFDVEVAGAGAAALTAGDAPAYGALLRAVGFAETLTPTTSAVYNLVSEAFESVSLYYWLDGQVHKVTGARGTMSVNLQREQIPYFHFRMEGFYNSPAAGASVSPTFAGFQIPLPITATNTSLSLLSQAVLTEQAMFDLANQTANRFLINGNNIIISDRKPTCTFLVEAPDIGTYDFFGDLESHAGVITTGAAQVIHGINAGNIVTFDANLQLSQISLQDSDGLVGYNMNGMLIPTSAGNDEFSITVT